MKREYLVVGRTYKITPMSAHYDTLTDNIGNLVDISNSGVHMIEDVNNPKITTYVAE